jgi:hypothetical protein
MSSCFKIVVPVSSVVQVQWYKVWNTLLSSSSVEHSSLDNSQSTEMQFNAIVALALATLAAATPTRRTNSPATVCCKNVTTAGDPSATSILGALGIVVQDVNALVGLSCTDVIVIGGETTW